VFVILALGSPVFPIRRWTFDPPEAVKLLLAYGEFDVHLFSTSASSAPRAKRAVIKNHMERPQLQLLPVHRIYFDVQFTFPNSLPYPCPD
jgi:hypothetical protein